MKRDQLDYVQFDIDFLNKPKIKALAYKFGPMSQMLLIATLFDMGGATNGEIDDDAFSALGCIYGFAEEKTAEILKYFIDTGVLFRSESNKISNSRIVESQEQVAEKRRKWREAKGIDGDSTPIPTDTALVPTGIQPESDNIQDGILKDSKDINSKDLNLEKKGVLGEEKPLVPIPKVNLAPKISVTEAQKQQLIDEFGAESVDYHAKSASDWLLSKGQNRKDYAAFLRNWIRKGIAECTGFYHPSRRTNGQLSQRRLSPTERTMEAFKNVETMMQNKNKLRIA